MSADAWSYCPRCLEKAKSAYVAKLRAVQATYGTVPEDEYRAAYEIASKPFDSEPYYTFREDYELGILPEREKFYVIYSGRCEGCSFEVTFNHEEDLPQ